TSPTNANADVFAENPLGKVPVLLRTGLPPLFDSDVICAYLDTLHEGDRLIPEADEERWRALRLQAVAQGMAEAGIAIRWESIRRPAHLRYPSLQFGYERKLEQSYAWLDYELHDNESSHPNIGHIALAMTLPPSFIQRDVDSGGCFGPAEPGGGRGLAWSWPLSAAPGPVVG